MSRHKNTIDIDTESTISADIAAIDAYRCEVLRIARTATVAPTRVWLARQLGVDRATLTRRLQVLGIVLNNATLLNNATQSDNKAN